MNVKTFERFYNRWRLPLGMYVLRIIQDTDEAEDIVQESFTKLWYLLENGFQPDSMKSYLYTIGRNMALNKLSHNKNLESIDISAELKVITPDEAEIEQSERDAELWLAIENLPERQREVFLMAKRDGLSYKEIGAELGISPRTVENHVAGATKKLQTSLRKIHFPNFTILFYF